MKFQHTSYFCSEIITPMGESTLLLDCQLEVQINEKGMPIALVIPDLHSLRQLQQEINLKLSELDKKAVDSNKQTN